MGSGSIELKVEGMTCDGCVRAVQKKLLAIDGVFAANVDLAQHKASVSYDPARVEPSALVTAVQQIGYSASAA